MKYPIFQLNYVFKKEEWKANDFEIVGALLREYSRILLVDFAKLCVIYMKIYGIESPDSFIVILLVATGAGQEDWAKSAGHLTKECHPPSLPLKLVKEFNSLLLEATL